MNKIYKIIFNKSTGTFTVASELAKAEGKSSAATVGSVDNVSSGNFYMSKVYSLIGGALGTMLLNMPIVVGTTMLPVSEAVAVVCSNNLGTSDQRTSLACGTESSTGNFTNAVALGGVAKTVSEGGTAVGYSSYSGTQSVAIGKIANASSQYSVAIGTEARANTTNSSQGVAIGYKSNASGDQSTAIGANAIASGASSVAIGGDDLDSVSKYNIDGSTPSTNINGGTLNTEFKKIANIDLVDMTQDSRGNRINQYPATQSSGQGSVAVGVQAVSAGHLSTAFGTSASSSGFTSIAIGVAADAKGTGALASGPGAKAEGNTSISLGADAKAANLNSVAISQKANATGDNAIAIGQLANATKTDATALGSSANAVETNATAIGAYANASKANAVALGNGSTTLTDATKQTSVPLNGVLYNDFTGHTSVDAGDQVSVGYVGQERQIKHVAPGLIASDSTDAINGSQLYSAIKYGHWKLNANNNKVGDVNWGDAVNIISSDSTVTITPTQEAAVNGVNTSILDLKVPTTSLTQDTNTMQFNSQSNQGARLINATTLATHLNTVGFRLTGGQSGNGNFTDSATDKKITNGDEFTLKALDGIKITQINNGYEISTIVKEVTTQSNKATVATGTGNSAATVQSVADAINNSGFTLKTSGVDGGTKTGEGDEVINPGDAVEMVAGKNLTVAQATSGKVTYATKDDVVFNSLTLGNNGPKITQDGNNIKIGTQNGGSVQLTNVASGGTVDTNAANIGDVKKAKTEVVAGTNVNISNRTGNNGQTIYTVNAYNTTAESISPEYISVKGKAATEANTTKYEIGLTEKAINEFKKDNDTITTAIDDGKGYITVKEMERPAEGATHTYNVGLTDKAIKDFTKDTQASVVSTDKTVTINSAGKNENGTVIYDLSVNIPTPSLTTITSSKGSATTPSGSSFVNATQVVQAVNNSGFIAQATNTASGASTGGTEHFVQSGSTVTFEADKNINITQANGKFSFATKENVEFNNVKTSTLEAGPVMINNNGINANNTAINNVNAAELSPESKQAVNGSQLYTTNQNVAQNKADITKGINFGGTTGSNKYALGDTINVKGGSNIISNTVEGGAQLSLAKNITVDSVSAGNTSIKNDEVKVGGNTLTNAPITVNKTPITNVNEAINKTAEQAFNPLTFAGDNSGKNFERKLGEQVNLKGGAEEAQLSEKNIGVVSNGVDTLDVKLAKELKGLTSAEFKDESGNKTVINSTGTTITPAAGNTVSLTTAGLNNGNNKITNVVAGNVTSDSKEAINGSQLYDVIEKGFKITADNGGMEDTVRLSETVAYRSASNNIVTTVSNNNIDFDLASKITVGKTAEKPVVIDGTNGIVSGLTNNLPAPANTAQPKQAELDNKLSNAATVSDVLNTGWNLQENSQAKDFVKAYDTVNFVNGTGTTANVTMNNDNTIASVTFNVNSTTITQNTTSGKAEAGNANHFATAANVADAINKTGLKFSGDVKDVSAVANTFMRENQAETKIIGGVTDTTKLTDGNIGVVSNGSDTLTVKLAKDINVANVTATNNIVVGDGENLTKLTSTADGLKVEKTDGTTQKITNVANGSNANDAVNFSQLEAVKNQAWNLKVAKDSEPVTTVGDGKINGDNNVTFTGKGAVKVTSGSTTDEVANYAVNIEVETAKISTNTTTGKAGTGDNGTETAPNVTALATAGDVINALNSTFWKVGQGEGNTATKKDDVKAGDTVNFANGTGTLASVNTNADGVTTTVKYSIDKGTITSNADTGIISTTDGDNKVATTKEVVDAIKNSGFKLKATKSDGEVEGTSEEVVNQGETVTIDAGKNIKLKQANGKITVTTTENVSFNNVAVSGNVTAGDTVLSQTGITIDNGTAGKPVTLTKNGLDNGDNKITNVAAGNVTVDSKEAINGSQLYDVIEKGFKITADNGGEDTVRLNETVAYRSASGNIVTTVSNNKIDFDLANKVIVGKNATNPITIDGTTGTVTGLTNKTWNPDNITSGRAATEDQLKLVSQVANAGWNLTASGTNSTNVAAGDTVDLNNTDGNIVISKTADADQVTFNLSKNIKVNSVTSNTLTVPTDTENKPITINNKGIDLADQTISNVASNLPVTNSTADAGTNTLSQVKPTDLGNKINNAATVSDILNAGWNLQENGTAKDFVKAYDTVNFANGTGTTANVTMNADGSVANVKFDINTSTLTNNNSNGTVTATTPGNFVTAEQVAQAVNNAGFIANATASAGEVSGTKNQLVKTGETVTFDAGKNINITQSNGKFTFATKENVKFSNVSVKNGLTIGDGANTSTLTSTDKGLDVGGDTINNVGSGLKKEDGSVATKFSEANQTNAVNVGDLANSKWALNTSQDGANKAQVGEINPDDSVTINGVGVVKVTNSAEKDGESKVHIAVETQALKVENGTATTNGNSKSGETVNSAPNLSALSTVGDVINVANNVSWSIHQGSGSAVNNVKAGNEVHFVDSDQFTANVTKDGDTKTNVTFTAKTIELTDVAKDGKIDAPIVEADKKKLVTAENVANAINAAGWNAKSGGNKAAGDDASTTLINSGEEVSFIAGDNLTVKREGNNFTFATAKDVSFSNITVSGNVTAGDTVLNQNGITINNGTAGKPVTLTKNGLDNGGNKITNVAAGANTNIVNVNPKEAVTPKVLADLANGTTTNALTVADAQNMGFVVAAKGNNYSDVVKNANKVEFVGEGNVKVRGKTDDDGVRTITVDVNNQNVMNNSQLPVAYTKADGTKVVKANDGKFYDASDVNEDGSVKTVDGQPTPTALDPKTIITSLNNGENSTTTPTVLTNIAGNLAPTYKVGDYTVDPTTGKPSNDKAIAPTKSQLAPDFETAKKLYNNAATVGDVLNAGWNLQENGQAKDFVKVYDTVNFVNGTGTTANVTMNADGSVANVTFNSALSYKNENASDTSTPSNTVNLVSPNDKPVQITNTASGVRDEVGESPKGKDIVDAINNAAGNTLNHSVNVGDLKAVANAAKTKVTSNNKTIDISPPSIDESTGATTFNVEVANTTLTPDSKGKVGTPTSENSTKFVNAGDLATALNNSGWNAKSGGNKSEGDEEDATLINPGEEVEFNAGKNLKVKRVGNVFTFETASNTVFDSIRLTLGNLVPTTSRDFIIDQNGDKKEAPNKTIEVKAPELADLLALNNKAATVGDVLNAGWNLQENGTAKDFVKAYDTVNFANGTGTTANVTMSDDGSVGKVKFDINTSTLTNDPNNGKVAAAQPNNFATAGDVAQAVNNAGFIAKATQSTGVATGTKDQLVKTGETVTLDAGKNIKIVQDGSKFTFETKDDVNFNNVQLGGNDGPKLTNDGENIKVSKTDGSATKITNVAAGDVNATSSDAVNGAQLYTQMMASREDVTSKDKSVTINKERKTADGAQIFDLSVNTDNVTIEKDLQTGALKVKTTALTDANSDGAVDVPTDDNAQKLVNAADIAKAINNSGWKLAADGTEGNELINPSDTVTFKAGDNLNVKRDGANITYALNKDISVDSVKAGNTTVDTNGVKNGDTSLTKDGITINNGTAGNPVKLDKNGLDNGGNRIKNIAEGTEGTDAVNVNQLNRAVAASQEDVVSTDGSITVQREVNPVTKATTFDVSVNVDNTTITKDKDGQLTANTVSLTNDVNGKVNNPIIAGRDVGKSLVTAQTVVDVINNAGFNVKSGGNKAEGDQATSQLIKTGSEVTFNAGDNLKVKRIGNEFTFETAKDVSFENVTSNTIKVPTDNADKLITITKDGISAGDKTISNVASNLAPVTALNEKQPDANNLTNLADKLNNAATVADVLNAGWNLQNNDTAVDTVTHNDTVNFVNGRGTTVSVTPNADGTVNNIQVDSALGYVNKDANDSSTPSNTVKIFGEDNSPVQITNVASGVRNEDGTALKGKELAGAIQKATGDVLNNAVNVGDLQAAVNAATTKVEGDQGVTVTPETQKDGSTTYSVAAKTDGKTVTVKDGNIAAVTTHLTHNALGYVEIPTDGDALVNAKTVADAINASGFTLKTSANGGSKISGSDELINAGDVIDMVASKNLTVKQEANGKVTYATKDDVTFNTVNSTTVVVGDATDPAKSTTLTSGDKGLDVGGDKITNVANGDISPVSTDVINGSQLNNYTKVNGNNIGTDNGAINIVNGAGTTVTSDKAGEVKVNVNNTDLTVADNGTINVQDPNGTGAHYVNATTVAKAVNNVSWNVTSDEVEGTNGKSTYTANAESKVKTGETMKVRAGRNVEISGKGKTVDIAVSDNPEFNTVKVGKGNNVTTISSDADGVRIAKADGSPQRITNVAAGRADNDAVNVGQLKGAVNNLDNKINRNKREARAGIAGAAAIAGLPEIHLAGKSMLATAASTYKGENAIAVGYSRLSDNSKVKLKITGSADTKGDFIGTVGVGYAW
ncbi:ESPR-type extended signal peptide-containing protein [Mannheimia indoligenes]|uniref:ESPR-type extended signal peptide-containing protein n=1 Tax=Mannheimia indoligenes TaxID=3103145 RepID=UPI002FE51538